MIRYKKNPLASNADIKKCMRNITVFRISNFYNLHKDYVNELIIKSRIYNPEYIEGMFEQYKGDLFSNINEVKRLVVSNYIDEEDFGKRPLSKLARDISIELRLIK